ncbi:hypothetical protein NL676_039219, partial [Syzygium grande]
MGGRRPNGGLHTTAAGPEVEMWEGFGAERKAGEKGVTGRLGERNGGDRRHGGDRAMLVTDEAVGSRPTATDVESPATAAARMDRASGGRGQGEEVATELSFPAKTGEAKKGRAMRERGGR